MNHFEPINIPDIDLVEAFKYSVDQYGQKPAMIFLDEKISYKKYDQLTNRFANGLLEAGLQKGDRVAINLPNLPQYLIALFGSLKAGMVISGLSPLATPVEIKKQLEDLDARVLVTYDQNLVDKVLTIIDNLDQLKLIVVTRPLDLISPVKQFFARLLRKLPYPKINFSIDERIISFKKFLNTSVKDPGDAGIKPTDTAAIQYTGGTTGLPKGAMLSHANLIANIYQGIPITKPELGNETGLSILPFFHTAGLIGGLNTAIIGACWVLIPNPRDLDFIMRNIQKYQPSLIFAVPLLYQRLLDREDFRQTDFSFLKYALSGAATYPAEMVEPLERVIGKKLLEGYGMTEASPGITCTPPGRLKPGSVGVPIPHTEVKIIDIENGTELAPQQRGQLIVRGPQVMQGYHKLGDEQALQNFEEKKWLFTGDVAYIDDEGFVFICDRIKDMINVSGNKVFSIEVEETILKHPGVSYCAIVGRPDSENMGNEEVVLYAQVTDHPDAALSDELLEYCRNNLAPYKVPRAIEFVSEMPVTPIGKVDKKRLRQLISAS